jgi:hypothetical protein
LGREEVGSLVEGLWLLMERAAFIGRGRPFKEGRTALASVAFGGVQPLRSMVVIISLNGH